MLESNFNDKMRRDFDADWNNLQAEWLAFVATLDHGFDFDRMAIDFKKADRSLARHRDQSRNQLPSGVGNRRVFGSRRARRTEFPRQVAIKLRPNKSTASQQAWPCEPGGVSIEYHDGHPLGMLLGAINPAVRIAAERADVVRRSDSDRPRGDHQTQNSGTLYLRVNDSAAKLDDNRGHSL